MLSFGVIGCGVIGGLTGRLLAGADETSSAAFAGRARLVAVAARSARSTQVAATALGCDATTVSDLVRRPDVDAVCVCTPSGTHADLAIAALEAGKHVLVEKPVDIGLAAADRLIDTAERAGRALGVVSQHRFDPAARVAHRAITAGDLGRIGSVQIEVPFWRSTGYYTSGDWRGTRSLDGGGALMNQGVHAIDLAQWLAGPIVEVSADTARRAHPHIEVEDTVAASFTSADGALGTLLATTAAYPGRHSRISVHGDRGSLVIEGESLVYFHAAREGRTGTVGAYGAYGAQNMAGELAACATAPDGDDRDATGQPRWAHRDLILDFCAAVESGRRPLVDGYAGRRAVAVVTAVYESAARHRSVAVASRTAEEQLTP